MRKIRKFLYNIIREDKDEDCDGLARIFNIVSMTLILSNVGFLILDTLPNIPAWYHLLSLWVERVTMVVFTAEYLARLWTAPLQYPRLTTTKAILRYAFSFMAVIDLVSILPFYLPLLFSADLSVLRLLRIIKLLRLFKFNRYNHALDTIYRVFQKKAGQLISSLLAVCVLLVISSILMFSVENYAQPHVFSSILDGLWWSLSSITSANYGSIYPITIAGKALSAIIAFLGIGLIAVPTGIVSAGFVDVMNDDNPALSPTAADEIQKFWSLKEQGIITPEEFESKKNELLGLD